MKSYGLPRIPDADKKYPDGFANWEFAIRGCRIFNKKGTRRIYKKRARALLARDLRKEIENEKDFG
jgi:hypothetical protein